ncbi:EmrB/QacA subfamily drug resistance transporter [Pullulanibacillus pueri]|uniref:MFS transporter n=1 Tax=Pullulanibacillus pueri TaxID=1437324 RepID=A0A8J3EJR0_9BACL|nr:MDR family MFS transporter [Pullulanibacillus pueri]MBM7680050.1 EmrB/QacA subfamily drug resistance transporter [Pullulanibacillus pueri]GGH74114.1 MFS transporter [Pullulanibacillus pueri]
MEQVAVLTDKDKKRRSLVLGSLILGMFMASIEATIVATAIPAIVGDLGGFKLYSWVFSAYLLMNALTILIYGKLSDLFGRKPVFLFGLIVFLIGSLCAGFAGSMKLLILFRVIQGLGAGAVQPIAMTIVGDLYTIKERSQIQGYLSSVWGISAICGPALGGVFVEYISWSWVFWINLPLGILSIIGILIFFNEKVEKQKHSIDYLGSFLMFVVISSLMIVLIQGGVAWSWLSLPVLLLILLFVIGIILFIWRERKAQEPVVPLVIWQNPLIAIANTVSLTTGIVTIGLTTFLPSFVQSIMGQSAIIAGFTLTTMSIGWPLSSTIVGRLLLKRSHRLLLTIGGAFLVVGGILFFLLNGEKGPIYAAISSFVIGLGMGSTSTIFIVAIQNSVPWKLRGAATSSNMFMRMLGSAIGAALLGGLLNTRLQNFISEHGAKEHLTINSANAVLENKSVNLSAHAMALLKHGLEVALHSVYIGVFIFTVISLILIICIPKKYFSSRDE